jgi:UDP-2,3-diacylglucosamine pyrophosphatase LpxH
VPHYRSLFISDIHLSFNGSNPDKVLRLLKDNSFDFIYLVGDIIDLWAMKSSPHWPEPANQVIRRLLKLAHNGTKVVYLPGNHDDFLRTVSPIDFGNITIIDRAIHVSAKGEKYLVIHGDQFDSIVSKIKWLAVLGAWIYDLLLWINGPINAVRRLLGISSHFSLAAALKKKTKAATSFISSFETTLAMAAKAAGCNGVICGHIHTPEHSVINGITYLNCGDMVESMSFIIEDFHGNLAIQRF